MASNHAGFPGGVKLTFDCSPECSHLILFNPPRPYFAVDPATNANNGVNLYAQGDPSSGIAVLKSGESLSAQFSMRVDFRQKSYVERMIRI